MDRQDVTAQLENAVAVLDASIRSCEAELIKRGITVLHARDVNGRFLMLDAYVARVNGLGALLWQGKASHD